MLGNGGAISLIKPPNPGPLSFGLGTQYFVLGAQLAPGEKRLVFIPDFS